jgi:dolichol-phosphate mannosyltransferase
MLTTAKEPNLRRNLSVEQNLIEMERSREAYWLRYPRTSPMKLRWRAVAVRHCFGAFPGESILEIGAGSGLWTRHLTDVLRGENPITAAVFNPDLARSANARAMRNVRVVSSESLAADLSPGSFDYIVGTAILCHNQYEQSLRTLFGLLKPGGQLLFFEANYWNPQVFVKNVIPPIGRWTGQAPCEAAMRKHKLMQAASRQGFVETEIVPFDIVHPRIPRGMIRSLQSISYIVEHTPIIRESCGTLYIWAKKPGGPETRPVVDLAEHKGLYNSTSVVVPCYNEETNIPRLVEGLTGMYGSYIHEIIIVNDNSSDRTEEVTREIISRDPKVKLINRKPPNGVGRALRDGYQAAAGRYILTMDSDFVSILPELRDLFDAVARGRDGALGSRFSYDSMLVNYPFAKILCNRLFHLLVNIFFDIRVRDLSNNLKLCRAEILKTIKIEQPHFAANAETGLKPLLAGYDIEEVPISWIDRGADMGVSTFKLVSVAPGYLFALLSALRRNQRRTFKGGRKSPAMPESDINRM